MSWRDEAKEAFTEFPGDARSAVEKSYDKIVNDNDRDFSPKRRNFLQIAGVAAAGGVADLTEDGDFDSFDTAANVATTGASYVPDAARFAGSQGASIIDWLTFWDNGGDGDQLEIGIENPRPGRSYEDSIPYDIGVINDVDAVFELEFDGDTVLSQTVSENAGIGERTFSDSLEPEEEGSYTFGVGLSPEDEAPQGGDIRNHTQYSKFTVDYVPEVANSGGSESTPDGSDTPVDSDTPDDDGGSEGTPVGGGELEPTPDGSGTPTDPNYASQICSEYSDLSEDVQTDFENILNTLEDADEYELRDVEIDRGLFIAGRIGPYVITGQQGEQDQIGASEEFAQILEEAYGNDEGQFYNALESIVDGGC